MSQWRREAIQKFPEMHRTISEAYDVGEVWWELHKRLRQLYYVMPFDEDYVRRVYEYARWCLHHRSIDVRTAVVLWFYEALPADPRTTEDMVRWISTEEFELLDFTWRYAIKDEEEHKAFERDFFERKQRMAENRP